MNAEFYRAAYLAHLFDWTEPIHGRFNWLFVVLDSNRNILATEHNCAPLLEKQRISFKYAAEGLWLFSSNVVKPYIRDSFASPFSACYIFDNNIESCPKPSFNMTTDRGAQFTDSDISDLIEEIKRLNAIGYAADGGGLQWVSFDDELTALIRDGFELWKRIGKSV